MTLPGGEEDPRPSLEALSGRHLPCWTTWWQPQAPPKSGVHSTLETPGQSCLGSLVGRAMEFSREAVLAQAVQLQEMSWPHSSLAWALPELVGLP